MDTTELAAIEIREGDIYLVIHDPNTDEAALRRYVLDLIESRGITDIDFEVLNETLKDRGTAREHNISANARELRDEKAIIEVSDDRMQATIRFMRADRHGRKLAGKDIRRQVYNAGIIFGLQEQTLREISIIRDYETSYVIATGTEPVHGMDGYLQYHFDKDTILPKPTILEDGSVDYHQLGLFQQCKAGETLITAIAPENGIDGMDVLGTTIWHNKGKPAPRFPKGKNVAISDDNERLVAVLGGRIIYERNRIFVSPSLEIKGDVDTSTGNIFFNGSITVHGNVKSGFSVKSEGTVEIRGVVEAAEVHSKADLIIRGGVQGGDNTKLSASGSITAKFLENCSVVAGSDITADSILHSMVLCGGSITLLGKSGALVGGKAVAHDKVTAKVIGSTMATPTFVEVGHDPIKVNEYEKIRAEMKKMKHDYDRVGKSAVSLKAKMSREVLSDNHKQMLIKLLKAKILMRDKMEKSRSRLIELLPYLENQNGLIRASEVIHYGVKTTIGNAVLYVKDNLFASELTNQEGRVFINPLT